MIFKFFSGNAIAGIVLLCLSFSFSACHKKVLPVLKLKQKLVASNAWTKLHSYPQKIGRTDDLSFVTPQLGWAINSQGVLHHTKDGGDTWDLQFKKEDSFFRCLVFKDSLNGWLGTLGTDDDYLHSTDPVALYETHDGGDTWTPTKITGPYPKGLCGMQKVNEDVIVACGRVRGPSYFLKSVDGGETWISKELNHIAGSLIAPHFFDANNGILVGGTTRDKENCRSLMLSTADGGETWDTLYISKQKGEYLWKLSFPTRSIGYVSVQRNNKDGKTFFLKTKDGGKTWGEKEYADGHYYAQGIGFVNEKVGWIGGSFRYSYETRDGGDTWFPVTTGKGINNFQFINGKGYMVGRGIYRLNNLDVLPNGWEVTHYQNGQLEEKKQYKNGVRDGQALHYFANGQLESKGRYRQNLKSGTWKFYNENGRLLKKTKYRNDLAKVSKKVLERYEGVYRVDENALRFILYRDGQLFSKRSDHPQYFKIHPQSDDTFFYDHNFELKITFVPDDTQNIQHTISFRPGGEQKALKVDEANTKELMQKEKAALENYLRQNAEE